MPLTRLALRALQRLEPSKIILAAIPGGIRAVAQEAGVSTGRVSQVLRQNRHYEILFSPYKRKHEYPCLVTTRNQTGNPRHRPFDLVQPKEIGPVA